MLRVRFLLPTQSQFLTPLFDEQRLWIMMVCIEHFKQLFHSALQMP